ncbi:hypothetical protein [Paenibacillus cremeus]|uniref:DNA/RNA helicase n=1 Tax=Paenibacillus cremeus TaxID=2163881 RepID=A0A559KDX7_9BACL|nr:hypothetical protein [Paenibacillus cremeus]TVY10330.1 hypothetical protein FPZ49_09080 [Paenibacillus cremeus]
MSSAPIFFQFESRDSAALAQDTLEELGYQVSRHTETQHPTLHIIVDRHDLASALEIAQSHGGQLVELSGASGESETYTMAYDPEQMIPIPAHTVNEDWEGLSASDYVNRSSGAYNDDGDPMLDPSGHDYNGFDAGVHL